MWGWGHPSILDRRPAAQYDLHTPRGARERHWPAPHNPHDFTHHASSTTGAAVTSSASERHRLVHHSLPCHACLCFARHGSRLCLLLPSVRFRRAGRDGGRVPHRLHRHLQAPQARLLLPLPRGAAHAPRQQPAVRAPRGNHQANDAGGSAERAADGAGGGVQPAVVLEGGVGPPILR